MPSNLEESLTFNSFFSSFFTHCTIFAKSSHHSGNSKFFSQINTYEKILSPKEYGEEKNLNNNITFSFF